MAERVTSVKARRMGFEKDRGVLAVETETGLTFVRVEFGAGQPRDALALEILRPLAERGVCVRFLKIHSDSLSFLLSDPHLPAAREVLAAASLALEVCEGCAIVTLVAPNVRSITGLMARMGDALYARAIEVFQTADSHSSVSCVVPGERLAEAVGCLQGEFGLAGEAA